MSDSPYLDVHGHRALRDRILAALRRGRLAQSLLLHGPRGVGKQRLALWTAAALQCHEPDHRPCGRCRSCRLAGRLEHPDIHWFFPIPRPKRASSPEKLEEALEEARQSAIDERRSDPYYVDEPEEAAGLYVGTVRVLRRTAHRTPAMGPRKVLVIGRAEALIPQKGSEQAANALLKLLEEPPDGTHVLLTSDVPGALLPTIRSRVQSMRVPRLPAGEVASFLVDRREVPQDTANVLARRSEGSIGRALLLLDGSHEELRTEALAIVRAALDRGPLARYFVAHAQPSAGARGRFARSLDEARALLRDLIAADAGAPEVAADPELATELLERYSPNARDLLDTLDALEEARELVDRNVNPQLITIGFLRGLAGNSGDGGSHRSSTSEHRAGS